MGGLLKRNAAEWARIQALEGQFGEVMGLIANLQQEVASLRGRIRAEENQNLAANSRCERLETRVGKLEHLVRLPDVVERRFAPDDEDQEPRLRCKTCPTCSGYGEVWNQGVDVVACTSCEGRGYIDVAP